MNPEIAIALALMMPMDQSYSVCLTRVERGEKLTLAVGIDSPGAIRCDDAKRFGIGDGLYSCWFDGSAAKMQRIEASVPNVATPAYNPVTRYYSPTWNQSCPDGKCNAKPR